MKTDIAISITQSLRTLLNGPSDPVMAVKMRDKIAEKLEPMIAKISERKTVHEWLTSQKVPSTEMGKPLCLLRRLRIAMDRYQRYEDALHELIQATDCTRFQLTIIDEALEAHKDEIPSESNDVFRNAGGQSPAS